MENTHKYRVLAWWASGRTGIANCDVSPNAIHFATPAQFGGMEGRWTPEHILLTAVASCFTTTFQAVAERSRFDFRDLQVEAEGEVTKAESGYVFTDIIIRPTLSISEESGRDRGLALLHKAKSLCLISRMLASPPRIESRVEVCREVPVVCD